MKTKDNDRLMQDDLVKLPILEACKIIETLRGSASNFAALIGETVTALQGRTIETKRGNRQFASLKVVKVNAGTGVMQVVNVETKNEYVVHIQYTKIISIS